MPDVPAQLPTPPDTTSTPPPGAGGWVPQAKTPLWAAITVGVIGSSSPALMIALPNPWNAVVGGVLGGLAVALGTYYGIRSAGPRQP